MSTMIRSKLTFAANNTTATPQNTRPLSGPSPGDGYEKPGYRSSRAVVLGADNGARTRDPNLGKVVLYQLSHVRICKTKRAPERPDVAWRRSPDSNRG